MRAGWSFAYLAAAALLASFYPNRTLFRYAVLKYLEKRLAQFALKYVRGARLRAYAEVGPAMVMVALKKALKRQDTPAKRFIVAVYRSMETTRAPALPIIHDLVPAIISALSAAVAWTLMRAYWRPIFARRLEHPPRRLNLYGWGVPHQMGDLRIQMGEDCRLSTQVTLAGRTWSSPVPTLIIGDNVGISWAQSIFVGNRVVLGNNVRIGGQGALVGYPGHPLDPDLRAAGAPDTNAQVAEIIIGDDAWLGRGVTVNAGVRIGRAAVIASGAVVTRDIPPGVLAAGVPAKVVKLIAPQHAQARTVTDLLAIDDPANAPIAPFVPEGSVGPTSVGTRAPSK